MRAIRIAIVLIASLLTAVPLRAQAEAPVEQKISVNLQAVPLRQAIDELFKSAGRQYTVGPEVQSIPISLSLREATFDLALRLLIRQAAVTQPGLAFTKDGETYRIRLTAPETPAATLQTVKLSLQFLDVVALEKRLPILPVPDGISKILPLPAANAFLVNGTEEAIQGLTQLFRLMDVPSRSLTIHIGVTGPGVGGRPLALGSMARTLNATEVVLEDETTALGEMARIRVQVRPVVQGDGTVLAHSEWDISVPVAGGSKGPIRLVKRLTTSARLQAGRGITVGEVELAPFGGRGTVRLWLRASILPEGPVSRAVTDAGEPLDGVVVLGDQPYISVYSLAGSLKGQFRRGSNTKYELRANPEGSSAGLKPDEMPQHSGPYRLMIGTRTISDRLVFGDADLESGLLEPDTTGEAWLPLEDLASALFARLEYDSARNRYRFRGGHELSTLRFPVPVKAGGN